MLYYITNADMQRLARYAIGDSINIQIQNPGAWVDDVRGMVTEAHIIADHLGKTAIFLTLRPDAGGHHTANIHLRTSGQAGTALPH